MWSRMKSRLHAHNDLINKLVSKLASGAQSRCPCAHNDLVSKLSSRRPRTLGFPMMRTRRKHLLEQENTHVGLPKMRTRLKHQEN